MPIGQTFITSNSDVGAFEISGGFFLHITQHSSLLIFMSVSRESHFPPISARFRAPLFKASSLETTQDRAGKQKAICSSFPRQRQQQQQHKMGTLLFRSLLSLGVAKVSLLRNQNRCVPTECKQIQDRCKLVAFHEAHKLPLHSLSANKPLQLTGLFLFSFAKAALYFRRRRQFPLRNCGEK